MQRSHSDRLFVKKRAETLHSGYVSAPVQLYFVSCAGSFGRRILRRPDIHGSKYCLVVRGIVVGIGGHVQPAGRSLAVDVQPRRQKLLQHMDLRGQIAFVAKLYINLLFPQDVDIRLCRKVDGG